MVFKEDCDKRRCAGLLYINGKLLWDLEKKGNRQQLEGNLFFQS
jgi:hypothetical protein